MQDRLTVWRRFRDNFESSQKPLEEVAEFWSRAPFVSAYLNPNDPDRWPDPWRLIMDNKLDELAIVLGMLYTLKLTQRFMSCNFEIYMADSNYKKDKNYFLLVQDSVLNFEYGSVVGISALETIPTSKIWTCQTTQ